MKLGSEPYLNISKNCSVVLSLSIFIGLRYFWVNKNYLKYKIKLNLYMQLKQK